jgi:hypothetical protein
MCREEFFGSTIVGRQLTFLGENIKFSSAKLFVNM